MTYRFAHLGLGFSSVVLPLAKETWAACRIFGPFRRDLAICRPNRGALARVEAGVALELRIAALARVELAHARGISIAALARVEAGVALELRIAALARVGAGDRAGAAALASHEVATKILFGGQR